MNEEKQQISIQDLYNEITDIMSMAPVARKRTDVAFHLLKQLIEKFNEMDKKIEEHKDAGDS